MTYVLVAFSAALIALLTRGVAIYIHRSFYRQGFVGDAAIHFAIIRQLRKNGRSKYIDQYLIKAEPMSYPTAFHRYCALFPLALLQRRPYLPNLLLFCLSAALFAVYFRYVQIDLLRESGVAMLVTAIAFFFLLPGNHTFSGPSIAYIMLSERFLARASTGFYFLAIAMYSVYGDTPSLVLAVISGAIALAAALFARQAILFVTPVFALFQWSGAPLLALALSFGLAVLVSRSYLILSMRHTIAQWVLYATHTKKSAVIRSHLTRFSNPRYLWEARFRPKRFIWRAIQDEPGKTLLRLPEVWIAAALGLLELRGLATGSAVAAPIEALLLVIASGAVWYLLTALERLNHLGECYRYLEYPLYFVCPALVGFVAAPVADGSQFWISVAFISLLALGVTGLWVTHGVIATWIKWPDRDVLGEFMAEAKLPVGAVVFPIGLQVASDVCARREDIKSFWYQPGLISKEIFRDFIDEWPFLKRDPTWIFETFGVTHAICDKSVLQFLPWPCHLPGMEQVCENDRFVAFARVDGARLAGGAAPPVVTLFPKPVSVAS